MPDCPSCRAEKPDSTRYCAPRACYCGHEPCPAFPSYIPRTKPLGVVRASAKSRAAELWSDREEPTWLDR